MTGDHTPADTQPRGMRPGDLLVTLGGLAVFAFSFAPFVQYAGEVRASLPPEVGSDGRFSAWATETFMVPMTTFAILTALLAVALVWARFAVRRDPRPGGFALTQLEVTLALFSFLVLLGMILSNKHLFFGAGTDEGLRPLIGEGLGELQVGWGAVAMLLAAAVLLAGAVLDHLGVGPVLGGGAPAGGEQPPAAAPPSTPDAAATPPSESPSPQSPSPQTPGSREQPPENRTG